MVLDTNVFVSASVGGGKSRKLVEKIVSGRQCDLIISPDIIHEATRVLARPKFKDAGDEFERLLRQSSSIKIVFPESEFKAVPEDPADDMVINAAYDGRADYIVSGDRHLLGMKEFMGIPIITVARMFDLLQARSGGR